MSFFSEPNRDSDTIALNDAATGPSIGFLDSMSAAYEAQIRTQSMFGLEAAFRDIEQEQAREIRKNGGTAPRSLNESEDGLLSGFTGGWNSRRYLDAARYFATGEDRDGISGIIAERETALADVAGRYPSASLRNYREMFDEVRERAQRAERKWEGSTTTMGGMVGGFIGGAAGSLDVRTDPWNFATLPIGAFGKTVAGRIGAQAGGQAAIEGVNQGFGAQENRSLLGLDYGVSQAITNVAGAAVVGGALQGAGEGLAALSRRWFRNTPNDPAPPPVERTAPSVAAQPEPLTAAAQPAPVSRINLMEDFDAFQAAVTRERQPLGPSRRAQAVSEQDGAHFMRQLDDWKGPNAWEVPPRTDVSMPSEVRTSRIDRPFDRAVDALETPDQVARRLDPETFRIYDKLDEQATRLRGWLSELDSGRVKLATESAATLDAEIAKVEAKLAKATPKNRSRLERELADLQGAREVQFEAVRGVDTLDQATVRKRLVALDEQMRDMAPLVSRAYGLAEGEWRSTGISAENLSILRDLQNRGSVEFKRPIDVPRTLADDTPILASQPEATASLPRDADVTDRLAVIVQAQQKQIEPAVQLFRSEAAKLSKAGAKADPEDPGVLTFPNGHALSLDKDVIFVPNDDGSGSRRLTIRQYLEEVSADDQVAKAVGSCSVGRTS